MYITIEFICEGSEFVHEFMTLWIHILNSYYQMWIHYPNVNSWIWFHIYDFVMRVHYWESRIIQYSEFMTSNSVVKYAIWIRFYEFVKNLTQIFLMNSSMDWICMNSWTWIHRRIDGCIHVALRSSSIQSTSTLLSLTVHSRFQLHWESASTAVFFTRPMNLINLDTNKFKSSANQWVQ